MNKVQFGLKNVYIAPIITGIIPTYQTPSAVKGAVSLSLEPVHNNFIIRSTNSIEQTVNDSISGYIGSLEFALLPEFFQTNILGNKKDKNNVIFDKAAVNSNRFALLFEISGDSSERRILFYNCKVIKRNSIVAETNGSNKIVQTDSFNIEIIPKTLNNMTLKASILKSENELIYNNWFSKVYE